MWETFNEPLRCPINQFGWKSYQLLKCVQYTFLEHPENNAASMRNSLVVQLEHTARGCGETVT